MGEVNSGTHFQNFMERKFQGENPYIDDLSCADKQFPEHLTRLRKIFEICKANDILLSPKKCHFNMKSLKVLDRVTAKDQKYVFQEFLPKNIFHRITFIA